MIGCKSIFVEKKNRFNVEGKSLLEDFKTNLRVESLENVSRNLFQLLCTILVVHQESIIRLLNHHLF